MTSATHPPQFHPPHRSSQVKVASGLNFLAGIYLLISGWVAHLTPGSTANAIIFGIIVAILAGSRAAGNAGPWASWLNVLIGIWMIISPWAYGYQVDTWKWNSIVVGIIFIVLGLWSTVAGSPRTPGPTTRAP